MSDSDCKFRVWINDTFGNEIHTGDILDVNDSVWGIVYFCNLCKCVQMHANLEQNKKICLRCEGLTDWQEVVDEVHNGTTIKIVGNIYDNPALLDKLDFLHFE